MNKGIGEKKHNDQKNIEKIFLALVLTLLPFLGISLYSYFQIQRDYLQQISDQLNLTAQLAEDNVSIHFAQYATRIADWATDGHIQEEVEKIAIADDSHASEQLGIYIKNNKQSLDSRIILTDIVDMTGMIIASTDQSRIGSILESRDILSKAFNSQRGEVYLLKTDSQSTHLYNVNHIELTSTIPSLKKGDIIGAIIIYISLDGIQDTLLSTSNIKVSSLINAVRLKENPESYIVDKHGFLMSGSQFPENVASQINVTSEAVRICNNNHQAFRGTYKNYRGVEVYAASVCPAGQFWMLIVEIAKSSVTQRYQQVHYIIFTVTGILTLLSVGMAFLYFKIMKNKIY